MFTCLRNNGFHVEDKHLIKCLRVGSSNEYLILTSVGCVITHKYTLKILYKSKHFPPRYKRKREWVFLLSEHQTKTPTRVFFYISVKNVSICTKFSEYVCEEYLAFHRSQNLIFIAFKFLSSTVVPWTRKPYASYRMVLFSMSLSDPWPGFQASRGFVSDSWAFLLSVLRKYHTFCIYFYTLYYFTQLWILLKIF